MWSMIWLTILISCQLIKAQCPTITDTDTTTQTETTTDSLMITSTTTITLAYCTETSTHTETTTEHSSTDTYTTTTATSTITTTETSTTPTETTSTRTIYVRDGITVIAKKAIIEQTPTPTATLTLQERRGGKGRRVTNADRLKYGLPLNKPYIRKPGRKRQAGQNDPSCTTAYETITQTDTATVTQTPTVYVEETTCLLTLTEDVTGKWLISISYPTFLASNREYIKVTDTIWDYDSRILETNTFTTTDTLTHTSVTQASPTVTTDHLTVTTTHTNVETVTIIY
ncbi:uncharacterized protein IL334_005493 [Kwoniella shivajii]|uniref:Uncharacterized protein n=1 Tax=Kwoniella shivajii TaxID=564305 RepID=A0ABZ1D799_9TREE|nr:hypothetical protein IL334_005493 [Kwoniella shivajii]